ncbi:hypothetical protein CDL12_20170 [Handroanthus impetiginosus]|uniref:S-protein homolog n=1 Tax=Handroanthus impetiginosus TaxID=429701 RepID=A0A2G9GPN9_9LAMI|nr:hypothetical protein CDL12_20170 [Handroanthus impetiginosus]
MLLSLFILSNLLHAFALEQPNCFTTPKILVDVSNSLSEPLLLRCKSGDTDLQYHILQTRGHFSWSFCVNFPRTTLFTCDLKTTTRKASFKAYEAGLEESCKNKKCLWTARDDGIYLYQFKFYNWSPLSRA